MPLTFRCHVCKTTDEILAVLFTSNGEPRFVRPEGRQMFTAWVPVEVGVKEGMVFWSAQPVLFCSADCAIGFNPDLKIKR